MIVTVDLNVVLDMFLKRGKHEDCLEFLTMCKDRKLTGFLPGHGIPTIYYVLRKSIGHALAIEAIQKLLHALEIAPTGKEIVRAAFDLNFRDFEDSLVAAGAEAVGSSYIITGNIRDFTSSRIPAITPSQYLLEFADGG